MDEQWAKAAITTTWAKNAAPWIVAVQAGQIESRQLVTDQAILEAILQRSPQSVLDLGCGEGWLARALAQQAIAVTGVDATPALVAAAQQAGGGDFRVLSYAAIAAGNLQLKVDVVACNFALFAQDEVTDLFKAIPALLNPQGALIVQTLHPLMVCGELPYQDGWRAGSWAGFSEEFTDPAPWYFRTLASWVQLFIHAGFHLRAIREPLHPQTQRPASLLFIAEVAAGG